MIEQGGVRLNNDAAKADPMFVFNGDHRGMLIDVVSGERECRAPVLDPIIRIAPVPLRGVSDGREHGSVGLNGPDDAHRGCYSVLNTVVAVVADPGMGRWRAREVTGRDDPATVFLNSHERLS
jgi:hypothetical protein